MTTKPSNSDTKNQLQQLLEENSQLINVILQFQNEGKMMEALLYQARLQINLTQLAVIADNHVYPGSVIPPPLSANAINDQPEKVNTQLVKFITFVRQNGLKDLGEASEFLSLPKESVVKIAKSYYEYLIAKNRIEDADQIKSDLAYNGIQISQE